MIFSSSPAQYFDIVMKAIFILNCADDDYRFDFIKKDGGYLLAFTTNPCFGGYWFEYELQAIRGLFIDMLIPEHCFSH